MTGNKQLDKIILGLNFLIVSAAIGLVYYSHNLIPKPVTDSEQEYSDLVSNSMQELQKPPVSFDEMVVNLYSRETRLRFLSLKMNVSLFSESDRELIKDYKFLIFDNLIDIAGNMKVKELNSITGRILLETRIKNKVNDLLNKSIIKKIYFSKFIIQ